MDTFDDFYLQNCLIDYGQEELVYFGVCCWCFFSNSSTVPLIVVYISVKLGYAGGFICDMGDGWEFGDIFHTLLISVSFIIAFINTSFLKFFSITFSFF